MKFYRKLPSSWRKTCNVRMEFNGTDDRLSASALFTSPLNGFSLFMSENVNIWQLQKRPRSPLNIFKFSYNYLMKFQCSSKRSIVEWEGSGGGKWEKYFRKTLTKLTFDNENLTVCLYQLCDHNHEREKYSINSTIFRIFVIDFNWSFH